MDVNEWMQMISTLGFPIVAYCAIFWKMSESDKDHKEEVQKLSDVIQNNTLTLQKLLDRMDGDKHDQ